MNLSTGARAPMRTACRDFAVATVDDAKIIVAGGKCQEASVKTLMVKLR